MTVIFRESDGAVFICATANQPGSIWNLEDVALHVLHKLAWAKVPSEYVERDFRTTLVVWAPLTFLEAPV